MKVIILILILLIETVTTVFLKASDSYYSIYFIIGCVGICSTVFFRERKDLLEKPSRIILSLFYALAVAIANVETSFITIGQSLFTVADHYDQYAHLESFANICALILVFIGWFFVSLYFLYSIDVLIIPKAAALLSKASKCGLSSKKVFIIAFVIIFTIDIINLVLFAAPGSLGGRQL
ncbi:MAG: hypothetical protein K5868_05085 [Lachnospiraceae bacterium]|nr:hypothetical protein [Lachnospiraceae bacterium]